MVHLMHNKILHVSPTVFWVIAHVVLIDMLWPPRPTIYWRSLRAERSLSVSSPTGYQPDTNFTNIHSRSLSHLASNGTQYFPPAA